MMNVLRKDKKEEEEGFGLAYLQLEKTSVIQEARIFNDAPLNPRKCIRILTKILVILNRGEKLTKNEATETFFAITKLFQSNYPTLRRMVYLVIKELSTIADDVIIVTSSLTKDMTGPELWFRGPAIRALCKITDATMVQSIERYLKQAIVDKSATIASSVLVSSTHLMRIAPDVVRRWTNEIIEASSSSKAMVQYHALGLLYLVRKNDRLAVNKLIQKFTRSPLRSPYAHCILVRIVAKQLEEEGIANNDSLMEFLESTLRMKAEMVVYEAARAIVSLRDVTAKEIAPAVSVLQSFCSSHKSVMRYAAVRTLSAVSMRHPAAVTACNLDLENLIADNNRSIATLAITTLLKTGTENNVDRLLKHICSFMAEITDEFKVIVLESIRSLATKYPRKYVVLLNFLSGLLRDTAGYTFKKAVVFAMESIIKEIPDAKSLGLLQLCEFIEDCEHMKLTQRILYLIGREGPYLNRPRQFIRYIYNRVVLESAPIKCTATTALARFGAYNEDLRPSILVLLQRIMLDEDDEVRDRATFYHFLLSTPELISDKSIRNTYLLTDELHLTPSELDRALFSYTQNPLAAEEGPFLLSSVPIAAAETQNQSSVAALADQSYLNLADVNGDEKTKVSTSDFSGKSRATVYNTSSSAAAGSLSSGDRFSEELASIPELAKLGPIFRSTRPEQLTEPEAEYQVTCTKHVFAAHVVLQFICLNTMEDQVLLNVSVSSEPEDSEFTVSEAIKCPRLAYKTPGSVYIVVDFPEDIGLHSTVFTNILKFTVKDSTADDSVPGYPDEYPLEELNLRFADSMQSLPKANWSLLWEELEDFEEVEETYALARHKTIKDTMKALLEHLGMHPWNRSDHLPQEQKSAHILQLQGVFRGNYEVLAKCKLARIAGSDPNAGITLNISIRSKNPEVSRVVADSLC